MMQPQSTRIHLIPLCRFMTRTSLLSTFYHMSSMLSVKLSYHDQYHQAHGYAYLCGRLDAVL